MSDTEVIVDADAEPTISDKKGMIHREFRADLSVSDGRTVDVRIVPYGERISHSDGRHGRGQSYQEEFLPGAFNHQLNAPNRVHANVEHEEGVNAKVGHGVLLREDRDGFYGTFRLLDTPAGETARQLIEAGALDGVSMEAREVRTLRDKDGVLKRAKVNLHAVAFTRFGAYREAKILALREEHDEVVEETIDEALLPVDMDSGVVERLLRQGFVLPDRYMAHPADTDTPPDGGTSEDGTRQPETHTTSLED